MNEFHPARLRRRSEAARWTLMLFFGVLAVAFFRAQVMEHDRFQLRAQGNRLRAVPLAAPRGAILDRNGKIIAENVPGYSVKLFATSSDSLRAVLRRLDRIVPLDSGLADEVVRRFQAARYEPSLVLGDAGFNVVARLEEHRTELPGLVIQAEPKRMYPDGQAVAHLVGYVSEVTESDLATDRYPGAGLGTTVGKGGLELEYDSLLRGRPGQRYIEVDVRGRMVREEGASPTLLPVPGEPIRTTIDLDLQRYIDSLWPPGVRGAVVAMTPKGEILALYSAPTFDPNEFIGGISARRWRELNDDPAHPLFNRALQARYPPASPFKLAISLMALEKGIINIHSHMEIPCRGGLQYGNRYFRCWKREGHGSLDLLGAIEKSCDVYFYQLGLRLQLPTILEDGVRLGFRSPTGVDLPGEATPIYPASTAYFDRRYGPRGWTAGSATLNFSIGQGENTQTVIGMTAFYQGLANGGVEVTPYVVKPSKQETRDYGLKPDQAQSIRRALTNVVRSGTATRSRQTEFDLAGKTGTAQNSGGLDHGWFVGFAPADEPKIVIGMIMEFAEHGSSVAPYVGQIARRYLLGPDTTRRVYLPIVEVPEDSAPRAVDLTPDMLPRPMAAPTVDSLLRPSRPR
ncbi:MAG: penicillin-binding protein 2 [Gemmatimonadales bacterium]